MRVKYGKLIDFELTKVLRRDQPAIEFKIYYQNPKTRMGHATGDWEKADILFYQSFNDAGDARAMMTIGSCSKPEINYYWVFLMGDGDLDSHTECFTDATRRDKTFENILQTIKEWSMHSPCRALWSPVREQIQLELI